MRLKLLFVCTGNTCRSPMAEAILNCLVKNMALDISAFSRGIMVCGNSPASLYADDAVRKICGADLSTHVSKQIKVKDISDADLILTMTAQHWNFLVQNYPEAAQKAYTISEYATGCSGNITDPFGSDISVYLDCARELYGLIEKILDKLSINQ